MKEEGERNIGGLWSSRLIVLDPLLPAECILHPQGTKGNHSALPASHHKPTHLGQVPSQRHGRSGHQYGRRSTIVISIIISSPLSSLYRCGKHHHTTTSTRSSSLQHHSRRHCSSSSTTSSTTCSVCSPCYRQASRPTNPLATDTGRPSGRGRLARKSQGRNAGRHCPRQNEQGEGQRLVHHQPHQQDLHAVGRQVLDVPPRREI